MRKGISILLLIFLTNSCISQHVEKSELALVVERNISRIEFSKLSFFANELLMLGSDTSFRSKFVNKLNQHNRITRRTVGDQQEYDLSLYLLYKSLATEGNDVPTDKNVKTFFLDLLSDNKSITFSVDESLILKQINNTERSLINGYDEGTVDESLFIFFCYQPLLLKNTLLNNGLTEDWSRIGVFLCNYIRENENPIPLRYRIKENIINRLNRDEIKHEFKELVNDLKECDVSSNLFD
ncbi:MAG TPA: hypothetical protein VD927_16955 [Chryseosolibacter sp.]|nr:hypothetical protein [Chryseosolibacter sp.]